MKTRRTIVDTDTGIVLLEMFDFLRKTGNRAARHIEIKRRGMDGTAYSVCLRPRF